MGSGTKDNNYNMSDDCEGKKLSDSNVSREIRLSELKGAVPETVSTQQYKVHVSFCQTFQPPSPLRQRHRTRYYDL